MTAIDIGNHLRSLFPSDERTELCTSVIPGLIDCISSISKALQTSHQVSLVGTANAFGDDQLNVDVASEAIVRTALSKCPSIVTASSEEDPIERAVVHKEDIQASTSAERYTVAFDPLDGSSIIAPNWTVGTIIGIWDGTSALGQAPASRQVAAVLGVYGPRTTAIVAIRVPGFSPALIEFGLTATERTLVRTDIKLSEPPFQTRYFAPANLRAAAEDEKYMALITHYISQKYTLRYIGGLVPDVVHMLVKGHGVYVSPVIGGKGAKLRRLFELCPVALVIECAGGKAVDSADGTDILARPVEHCDERGGLVCGNWQDVGFVVKSFVE